jgi:hypothetical protein
LTARVPCLPRGEVTLHIDYDHTRLLAGCNCRKGSHAEQHRKNNHRVNENHHVSHNLPSFGISLSSIIREMPQDYTNYIQPFHEKDDIHGYQERNGLSGRQAASMSPAYPQTSVWNKSEDCRL